VIREGVFDPDLPKEIIGGLIVWQAVLGWKSGKRRLHEVEAGESGIRLAAGSLHVKPKVGILSSYACCEKMPQAVMVLEMRSFSFECDFMVKRSNLSAIATALVHVFHPILSIPLAK